MEQQDDKALDQLIALEKEIAEIKSKLAMYDLIFHLATQRWPNLWNIAASANPQAQLRDMYEVLELELGFYTLTARIPTPSKTGLMYRPFTTAKVENPRVTLQTMLEQIRREINEGKRNGLQAGAGIAYSCPRCGEVLY